MWYQAMVAWYKTPMCRLYACSMHICNIYNKSGLAETTNSNHLIPIQGVGVTMLEVWASYSVSVYEVYFSDMVVTSLDEFLGHSNFSSKVFCVFRFCHWVDR